MTRAIRNALKPVAERVRAFCADCPWTVAVVLAAIILTAGYTRLGLGEALVATREGVLRGELWRLVSGNLVHSNLGQLGRDAVVFALLGGTYEGIIGRRWPLLVLASLVVPTGVFLLTQATLPAYFGLSGAVYALVAVAFLVEWRESHGRPPRWVIAFFTVTLLKLVYETATGRLLIPMELGPGVVPAPAAHIAGLGIGALVFFALRYRPQEDTGFRA